MLICFQGHATFRRSIPSQSAFYLFTLPQKTDILLPPWPIASINKNAALSSLASRMLHQTAAVNKTAFSYSRLSLGSLVFVQNTISKHWDQQAVVKPTRDNGESYILQLDKGKECIHGRILLRPVTNTVASTRITPTLSTVVAPLRRSARLQSKV